ncbi:CHAT domain-containing protein [Dactylosporangium aurantiacum]|uniref:CHAT domain-containing protein n=1 Tax=Dactylosporangium aurantiacum TaxID=35754 RepID=A0A9Q9IDQ5_9ACTN|nr:CHAT domain-containing protein [Dactylosporangium aurantiacum]MDG6106955.1 CHAT domain-containing protein [Dactylosporangium aurantiacum]UWZ50685.1 CHAT domain-containing protein [Dactylosporangium aurantiacum]
MSGGDRLSTRTEAVAAVQHRLERAAAGDRAAVTDTGALADAADLAGWAEPDRLDTEVVHLLAALHWLRLQFLPEGEHAADARSAVAWFARLLPWRPGAVPPALLPTLAEHAPPAGDGITDWQDEARRLLDDPDAAGHLALADRAVRLLRRALAATDHGDPDRLGLLADLGTALFQRFRRSGDLDDITAAVDAMTSVLDHAPPEDPELPRILSNLGAMLRMRFARTGLAADGAAAVDRLRASVDRTPPDDPSRATRLSNLGNALHSRFTRFGDPADIHAAVAAGRHAAELAPAGHPDRARILANLGNALQRRFELTGDMQDLTAAVAAGRAAVESTPAGHLDRPGRQASLANTLLTRFLRTGDRDDLDDAIATGGEAVAAADGHPNSGMYLSNLGTAFQVRFDWAGQLADLSTAVDLLRRAVSATPPDHVDRPARLSNLSTAYSTRASRTGDPADVDAAVAALREAFGAIPADHPDRPGIMSNLANVLWRRFSTSGESADLAEAVDLLGAAVAATPPDHTDRALYCSNLGNALRDRFSRTADPADIAGAVDAGTEAVRRTPTDHASRPVYLTNLSNALRDRFEHAVDPADLTAAIEVSREATVLTAADHPDRAGRLLNLANALWARFEWSGDRADVDATITLSAEAAGLTPRDHPARAGRLCNLANALLARSDRGGDPRDLAEAARHFAEGLGLETATPAWRVRCGVGLARLAADRGDWETAGPAWETVLSLLPLVVDRGLSRSDRQHNLRAFATVSTGAAAAALALGRPGQAWQALEQGRGVLLGQALDTSADHGLRRQHPGLAQEMSRVRALLNDESVSSPDIRRQARRDWEVLTRTLRTKAGYERFGELPTTGELRAAAGGGTVVALNVTAWRCDALLVSGDGVDTCPLPDLTGADAVARAQELLTAVRRPDWTTNPVMSDVLAWLWDTTVEPILAHLGHFTAPDGELPRVWWLATGPLSVLPIHAAGRHGGAAGGTALDRVVSSYAPTVRLLARARGRLSVRDVVRLDLPDAYLAFLSACTTAFGGTALLDESIHIASAFQAAGFAHVVGTLWEVDDHYGLEFAQRVYGQVTSGTTTANAVHRAARAARDRYPNNPHLWASHIHLGP